ncbi:VTT domain-containing protein [Streptomyces sp. CSDS2]|uniref:DedA family protein n=1 Tax=Streptomyces sp. CSDS2 TaxID=3055051 RepID=UPI0025B027D8|nr:VTT domain-containing protein [Streptomyces sp. CSDS2]MDN3262571.1 VTT domain-containing protein [Streptomyces sp. CSDS2]
MMTLALGPSWLDPNYLLDTYSVWGLLLIVFAESGLLIGFFLPGDSLLFTCGLLITSGELDFPLWGAIVLICIAAILGDQAGYMFGKKVGPSLFNRPDSRLFKQENVAKAHEFFEKYGPKSLILARFVPIVRTFTPIIAGVSGMRYRSFLLFNVIGGVLWGAGVTLLGSWLGNIEFVKTNIEAIFILIVLVSVIPIVVEYLRARGKGKKAAETRPQPQPVPAQQPAYQRPQPSYGQQPPVMDDATTQLRRVQPEQPHYEEQRYEQPGYQQPQQQPQQQDWNRQQGYDQYYDGQQQYQQPYQPQQYPQQQNWDQQQGYDQQRYDENGYPYDQRRQ